MKVSANRIEPKLFIWLIEAADVKRALFAAPSGRAARTRSANFLEQGERELTGSAE